MIKKLDFYREPLEIYEMLKDEPFSFILESSLFNEKYGRYSIISSSPFNVIEYSNDYECLDKLRNEMNKYIDNNNNKLEIPFTGGAVGYISYDVGRYIEKIKNKSISDLETPDIYFGLYNWAYIVDHKLNLLYIVTPDIDIHEEEKIINLRKNQLFAYNSNIQYNDDIDEKVILKSNFSKQEYIKTIDKVRNYIRSGDVYQVNLTQRFEGKTKRSSFDIYKDLKKIGPTLFGGLINFEKIQIISNSPERFIKIRDNIIETRPIKGTRPRGDSVEEDNKYKNELLNSEKDKAELLMIVDLERNDLGRVSEIGSVKVPDLFVLESYSNVHHLVATIEAVLDKDKDIYDVIKSTFPGGSITGAPKIRAMQVIEELEPTKRNVYTGSIGYIGFNKNVDLNIAIRTIIKKDERITFQVGGGITWDSIAIDEYNETIHKAKSIIKSLRGYIQDVNF